MSWYTRFNCAKSERRCVSCPECDLSHLDSRDPPVAEMAVGEASFNPRLSLEQPVGHGAHFISGDGTEVEAASECGIGALRQQRACSDELGDDTCHDGAWCDLARALISVMENTGKPKRTAATRPCGKARRIVMASSTDRKAMPPRMTASTPSIRDCGILVRFATVRLSTSGPSRHASRRRMAVMRPVLLLRKYATLQDMAATFALGTDIPLTSHP